MKLIILYISVMISQIKLSGLDKNSHKTVWLNINTTELEHKVNHDIHFIRTNGEKTIKFNLDCGDERIETLSESILNDIKNLINKEFKQKYIYNYTIGDTSILLSLEKYTEDYTTITYMVDEYKEPEVIEKSFKKDANTIGIIEENEKIEKEETKKVVKKSKKMKKDKKIDKNIDKNIDKKIEESLTNENIINVSGEEKKIVPFNEKQKETINMINSKLDTNENIIISGIGGSGKTYTLTHMYKLEPELYKNKSIAFCAPTNIVVLKFEKYRKMLQNIFHKVGFHTTSKLLGEKCVYIKGKKQFKIEHTMKNLIFKYDIIVIDETSMMKDEHITYINDHRQKIKLVIFAGDKHQLEAVNSNSLNIEDTESILEKPNISLIENIRTNNNQINIINTYLINVIGTYTSKFCYKIFIRDFYEILYKNSSSNIIIYESMDEFINKYLELYKTSTSVIGNYENKTCDYINGIIKEKIIKKDNIDIIGSHFQGQQIIFLEHYKYNVTSWNTSEVGFINNIEKYKYNFENLNINDLLNINIDLIKKYKNVECTSIHYNTYQKEEESNLKLKQSEQILNYIVFKNPKFIKLIEKFFKYINNSSGYYSYKMQIYNNEKSGTVYVLSNVENTDYRTYIKNIEDFIGKTEKTSKKCEESTLINDCIIQSFWKLLDKYRRDIFADIDSAFACTIHRLQGSSIPNMFINLEDIFTMKNSYNKLKCLYTSTSRAADNLIILINNDPLCKCNSFAKAKEDKKNNISYHICEKCGFLEYDNSTNTNYNSCNECKKNLYSYYIKNQKCYICSK